MSSLSEALETGPAPSAEERAEILRSLPEAFARLAGVPAGHPRFAERLPFAAGDVTGGSEIELQVVVLGTRENVDLPRAVDQSRYLANLRRRVARGDVGARSLRGLEHFLGNNTEGVWDNSWVRFPLSTLNGRAREVLAEDLRADRGDPASAPRADAAQFLVDGGQTVRVPVSHLLKLALASALGERPGLESAAGRMLDHFVNDNSSPESFSFHVPDLTPDGGNGLALARETAKRFLLTQVLLEYAGRRFRLHELGQRPLAFFSPHTPVRQRRLNALVPDSFYRELFMSPCLSGWRRGEQKRDYMHLCHQVLSRSQLHTLALLREAGILQHDLAVLPQVSNPSLACNGVHVSLGSRRLGEGLGRPGASFDARHEKAAADLAIKIQEHFLPLFVGTLSGAPYRLGFEDLHPERALGFLPHQLDHTHLRMIWRRWKKKAGLQLFGQPVSPSGIAWVDRVASALLRRKGDHLHDVRLLEYPCSLLSTDDAPAFDGLAGNQDRLKRDLAEMGIFDGRMSFYAPVKAREHARMGYSGFEVRLHSVFPSFAGEMTMAVNLQLLLTAAAYRWIASGRVSHADISDTPVVESERRQILFATAIGLPTFYTSRASANAFLGRILARARGSRASLRYAGHQRHSLPEFRLALVDFLRAEATDVIEQYGFGPLLHDLRERIREPAGDAAHRMAADMLGARAATRPMDLPAPEFNQAAERHYREDLRVRHTREALDMLAADLSAASVRLHHPDLAALVRDSSRTWGVDRLPALSRAFLRGVAEEGQLLDLIGALVLSFTLDRHPPEPPPCPPPSSRINTWSAPPAPCAPSA